MRMVGFFWKWDFCCSLFKWPSDPHNENDIVSKLVKKGEMSRTPRVSSSPEGMTLLFRTANLIS